MLCNITQNAMGQRGGTLPGPAGGYPGGGTLPGGYLGRRGTLAAGYPAGEYPAGGVPSHGTPPARSGWGGTQLGQHKEYLLHGGRYASCVHAGGLSCL